MSRRKLVRPDVFRQSLAASFPVCPRRTKFSLMAGDNVATGWVTDRGDLGSAFHEVAAEYIRTMAANKQERMSHQELMEVLYETMRKSAVVLDIDELDELRWLVLGLAKLSWPNLHDRLLTVEETLTLDIVCEDGEVRTFKGQPDVILMHGDGILVVDWKTSLGKPKHPGRTDPEPGEIIEGRKYLSDRGHFQGDSYSLLGMARYLPAKSCTFREFHVRSGQVRQVTLKRDEMEHVERRIKLILEQLDEAISGGPKDPRWFARAGSHCTRQCPVARSCPIPPEQRGDGVLDSQPKVDAAAQGLAKLDGQRVALRSQLKAAYEEHGWIGEVNEHEVLGWVETANGRKWAIHPKPEPSKPVSDVSSVFGKSSGEATT